MIRNPDRLAELEARHEREVVYKRTYPEALARFAALWAHARLLNPELGADWREDLEADLAVARAVNGLPPLADRAPRLRGDSDFTR